MLSGSSSIVLSLLGWSFIPDFATRQILNFVYFKSPIRITTAPTPGSLQHRKHYAITFSFVILTYLTYTLVQAARTMQPNFYQILGVTPNVDENGLKLAFRAFAKRNHPDRPEVGKKGEALFMAVRDAFEALKDPVVRFAYDRCVRRGIWARLTTNEYRGHLGWVQMSLHGETAVKRRASSCTKGLWCRLGTTLSLAWHSCSGLLSASRAQCLSCVLSIIEDDS